MKIRNILCSCGKSIDYEFNPAAIESEYRRKTLAALLVPHEDHFVTVYIDRNNVVRGIEQVILVKKDDSSVVVKTSSVRGSVLDRVKVLCKEKNPFKKFFSFLSLLISEITYPEDLFIAGRYIGYMFWNKKREPIIKLGATFKLDPKLLLSKEIVPIFEKLVKVEKISFDKETIVIKDSISPQFIVGAAQGILDGIHEHMNKNIDIAVKYVMSGATVFLTLKEVET